MKYTYASTVFLKQSFVKVLNISNILYHKMSMKTKGDDSSFKGKLYERFDIFVVIDFSFKMLYSVNRFAENLSIVFSKMNY